MRSRPGVFRRSSALAFILAVAAVCACFRAAQTFVGYRGGGRPRLRSCSRAASPDVEDAPAKPWQKGLDAALLDVDASPQERLEGLREFFAGAPSELPSILQKASQSIAEKGFKDGHPEALDLLFPKGTRARSDLEGLAAVARQTPEALKDLQGSGTPANQRSNNQAPSLEQISEGIAQLLSPDGLADAADEIGNVLRSTPRGLEEPTFEVIFAGEDFEVRQYRNFTVASRRMSKDENSGASASAEGFTTLAAYLFGSNDAQRSMKMTMPVEIDYTDEEPDVRTMSFVMPEAEVVGTSGLPKPEDPSVQLREVPERLVAIRCFPGIATAGEVRRQCDKLLVSLGKSGEYTPVGDGEYSVLQYNPPYTVPWRRRNEVAVVVVPGALRRRKATPDGSGDSLGQLEAEEVKASGAEAVARSPNTQQGTIDAEVIQEGAAKSEAESAIADVARGKPEEA